MSHARGPTSCCCLHPGARRKGGGGGRASEKSLESPERHRQGLQITDICLYINWVLPDTSDHIKYYLYFICMVWLYLLIMPWCGLCTCHIRQKLLSTLQYYSTSRWLWERVYNGWQVARLGHCRVCKRKLPLTHAVLGTKQEIRPQSRVDATCIVIV